MRGCGNNNSEYVTLGLRESIDLGYIIWFLIYKFPECELCLWGRQMGAVTLIHYLHFLET